ncbi:MAG: UDP-N-acetylmuramate dehydrogenase, partial [Turicibacter sanguinis]
QVTVGAGVSTILLANKVAKCELAGLEFISGVPGSVGGAIYMNAGAYNREIQDVLVKALILDEAGELKWLTVEEMGFSYRQSILQTHRNWIVVEAVLQLEKGSYEEIMELMKARKVRRIESQPTNLPSAGSTFRNPLPHYSWQLIEKSGLRGVRIGGAEVSQKHCNFIVNVGGATATDIYELIQHVQAVVFEKHGIQLHPEVEMFNW